RRDHSHPVIFGRSDRRRQCQQVTVVLGDPRAESPPALSVTCYGGASKLRMNLLDLLIDAYSVVILIAVVLSWLRQGSGNPFARFVASLTEPVLEPIRRRS